MCCSFPSQFSFLSCQGKEDKPSNLSLLVFFILLYIQILSLFTHQLAYLKMPRMSTSLTAALTMGMLTVGGPNPTSTKTPPDFVAYMKEKRNEFSRVSFYHKGTIVILCVCRRIIVNLHSCLNADVINISSLGFVSSIQLTYSIYLFEYIQTHSSWGQRWDLNRCHCN